MGKYMKKAKSLGGEVAVVMEVPRQTSLGVRTRARTLALQQQRRSAAAAPEDNNNNNAASYLQLRSRRLEKSLISKPKVPSCNQTSPRSGRGSSRAVEPVNSGSVIGSVSVCCSRGGEAAAAASDGSPEIDAGVEVSFGENAIDVETKGRSTRETTPCSFMRDSENIETLGSTTRPTTSTNRRIQNSVRRDIPTTQEIEDFFSEAEQIQQKKFIEKYNFDPVNEHPLPGRYEWVKSDD